MGFSQGSHRLLFLFLSFNKSPTFSTGLLLIIAVSYLWITKYPNMSLSWFNRELVGAGELGIRGEEIRKESAEEREQGQAISEMAQRCRPSSSCGGDIGRMTTHDIRMAQEIETWAPFNGTPCERYDDKFSMYSGEVAVAALFIAFCVHTFRYAQNLGVFDPFFIVLDMGSLFLVCTF